jgi:AraC-like DNA-binding protein/quercetin dioxygenase-like cupin family protein
MKHRQSDIAITTDARSDLETLKVLPRPVYGHVLGIANRAIGHPHTHPWAQLSYAMDGVLEVRTASGRYIAPALRAIWVPAGIEHGVHCSADTQLRSLYIDTSVARPAWRECRVLTVKPLLRELIREFSELPVEYDENSHEGRLVGVLLDQIALAPEAGLSLPWPKDARLRSICNEILEQPDTPTTLSEYGERLHLSERSLSRLFLQQTGLSFRQWRQRSRLLHSLSLLQKGQRVTDVALACGYESMPAFIAAFREQMGFTPKALFGKGE